MVEIQNLLFQYGRQTPLIEGLNLRLSAGHIYGLLGKNGVGKSTLLKNIAGLAFPREGQCLMHGINTARRLPATLSRLYFLAETVHVPALTPRQLQKSSAGFYRTFSSTDYEKYLNALDVDPQALLSRMSYGQQKKALIAFGLAANTALLIMDEPTNGLDIPSKVQFRRLMAAAVTDERCIIVSTHQVRDLENLIDTVIVLDNRSIVLQAAVDRLAEQLVFGYFADTTGLSVLYEEETLRGKNAILKNTDARYGKVDLELLFNAVTAPHPPLLTMLNHQDHA